MLLGCSHTGDFGRERADAVTGRFSDPDPLPIGSAGSAFPVTDDERELRALASGLLAPPLSPGLGPFARDGVSVYPAAAPVYDGPIYEAYLLEGSVSSTASRYARLTDDIRNDLVRLEPFFRVARRVADLDHKRERSLPYVTALSAQELVDTHRRVHENMLLIAEVHRTLLARSAMYRYALERLVIAQPSPFAVEAERLWAELDRRLIAIEVVAGRVESAVRRVRPAVTKP